MVGSHDAAFPVAAIQQLLKPCLSVRHFPLPTKMFRMRVVSNRLLYERPFGRSRTVCVGEPVV